MVSIYCIEDINDLKYIGSTRQALHTRITKHRYDKRNNRCCSSSKLNLDYCIIYELEKCEEKDRKEREQYWKDNTQCVNILNITFDRIKWRQENKERRLKYHKQYYQNNKSKWINYETK